MESLISYLQAGSELLPPQVEQAVAALISPEVSEGEKAAFLKALREKGETSGEIAAFAQALLQRAVPIELDPARLPGPTIDVCGTGGDRQGFFNVSTATMFVAAACGTCVVKHGNRSVTSKTGAADVLEELGIRIDLDPLTLRATLEEHGLAFIFAPAYHPAIKAIVPVRKALAAQGIPTIFNMLGPLLNPTRPDYQLVGIFSAELLPKYAAALSSLGRKRAWAVHGQGTDELTLTGSSQVHVVEGGTTRAFILQPEEFGLKLCTTDELRGGERAENAAILVAILEGKDRGPKRDVVVLNTAAACVVTGLAADLQEGIERAREAIDSGAALAKLQALRSISPRLS
jgi:anthranilate phosphoribosyltransferase